MERGPRGGRLWGLAGSASPGTPSSQATVKDQITALVAPEERSNGCQGPGTAPAANSTSSKRTKAGETRSEKEKKIVLSHRCRWPRGQQALPRLSVLFPWESSKEPVLDIYTMTF